MNSTLAKRRMNLCYCACLLIVTAVAINLFLGPAKLVSAQIGNYPIPNCSEDVASLGGIREGPRPAMLSVNPVIEVEFQFAFGCQRIHPLTRIDQGVRLEFRLPSAVSSTITGWLPIRYYAPSLEVPTMSLVELGPSNMFVVAQASVYNSTFPLIHIEPFQPAVLIREYICLQNFTEDLQLELRWMQRFGAASRMRSAPWIIDSINIRIWNGMGFLDVWSEDFSDNNLNSDSYETSKGRKKRQNQCPLSNTDAGLLFRQTADAPTTRYLIVNVTNIFMSYEEQAESTTSTAEETTRTVTPTMMTTPMVETTISTSNGDAESDAPTSEETVATTMMTTRMVEETTSTSEGDTESSAPTAEETTGTVATTTVTTPTMEEITSTLEGDAETDAPTVAETTWTIATTMMTTPMMEETTSTIEGNAETDAPTAEETTGTIATTKMTTPMMEETTSTSEGDGKVDTTMMTTSVVEATTSTLDGDGTSNAFVSSLLNGGVSEESLQVLLRMYGEPLPQAISEILISAAIDNLRSISRGGDTEAGVRALIFLDSFALRGYNSSFGKVSNDIFIMDVRDFSPENYMKSGKELEVLREPEGTISLPVELFSAFTSEHTPGIRVACFIFKNLSGILPEGTDDKNTNRTSLGSPVVSATLGCMGRSCSSSNYTLEKRIKIEIQPFSNSGDKKVQGLFFFDLVENIWLSRGCSCNSTLSKSSLFVCECDHLTHFAILLSPGLEIDPTNKLVLGTIGYVGVAISVFCMIATIFILTFLKALRGMRTFIHVNLCVCLGISQVIFISAVDKTAIKELCEAIAIALHYFWLTTFMWMLMEGVVLYVALVRVFIKRKFLYIIAFTVASYGMPAIYVFGVAVPLGFTIKDDQGRPQYGRSDACWLHYDQHFNWAFITPVLVIIIANIGFFIMAIFIMWKHEKRGVEKADLKRVRHWLKTAASLVVVMGITWIIGVLVFHKALLFVAYIFVILTAFQGTFIFILFVVMSKQVKDHYISWWRGKKSESEILSKIFTSSGWSKSSREIRSNIYSTTKPGTLETQTNNLCKGNGVTETAAGLQLRNMQMVDHTEDTSNFDTDYCSLPNFEGKSNNDYGSVLFANIQILDCNGEVCKFENLIQNNFVKRLNDKESSYPPKGTDQHTTSEDGIIENQITTD